MFISSKSAPLGGQTVYQAQIPSDVRQKSALASRLIDEAVASGLVGDADRKKYLACFEEAIHNAMVHGNQGDHSRQVFVRLFYDDDIGDWGVVVEDQGPGFKPSDLPDVDRPEFPLQDCGRGVRLMEHVMDKVEFFESGSTVVLRQPIGSLQLLVDAQQLEACSVFLKPVDGKGTIARLVLIHASDEDVDRVFDQLRKHCESNPGSVLVLDFCSVDYLNSCNIAKLVGLRKAADEFRVDLRVASLGEDLVTLFGILRLTDIFEIFDTVDDSFELARTDS